ncbi:MAG: hypothetical protein ABF323_10330 [Lentimonas sp.]
MKHTVSIFRLVFITTTLAVLALIYSSHEHWYYVIGPLHNMDLGYPFADMQARLGIAEAINHGIDVNHEHNPFTPSGALNNKPLYTVTIMALLSLKTSDSLILGILFGTIYCLWAFWLLRPTNWIETLISLAIFLSPPSLLLIERSNDDIIIFAFIMAVPLLLETGRLRGRVLGWIVISLLTPMKYYPAAAYALFLHRPKSLKELLGYTGASIAFVLGMLWLIRDELTTLTDRIPSPSINYSFGKTLLFECFNSLESTNIFFLVGALIIVLLGYLFLIHPKLQVKEAQPREELYFLLGSALLSFCFLLSGNWDYRLAFVIPTLPLTFLFLNGGERLPKMLALTYIVSLLLTLWPEYIYFFNIIEPKEDTWILNYDHYYIVAVLKHSASWIMIGSNILIACLILKSSLFKLMHDGLLIFKRDQETHTKTL